MNKILTLTLFVSVSYGGIVEDYLNKKYKKICNFKNIEKFSRNEKALSIVGVSCIKEDSIYLLPYIINKLKKTEYGRKNSIYFLTVYMEKKLLYSYLFDKISLKPFSFPMTDYILSFVFESVKAGNYETENGIIVIFDKKRDVTYRFYKKEDKMYIDEYKNKKLIKRRWYR
ncbi:hypothetical protein [Nautilia sp.]